MILFSIRLKLMGVVLLTTLIALSIAGAMFLYLDVNVYRLTRIADMESQLELISASSMPAVQFGDRAVATENLALLEIRESVSSAAIYTLDGNLFASYSRSAQEAPLPSAPEDENMYIADRSLIIFKPMLQDGRQIGTAYMRADYLLRERVLAFIRILALVTAAAMLLAFALSTWLQSKITRPILSVADIARKVVSFRDYSRRAEKLTNDEVGLLVDDFNDMLNEIENRTSALEQTNQELEQEIAERKRAREEVLRLNAELQRKIAELNEADRHKDDFLATLAHELRNPLAPIRSGLEVLHRSEGGDREAIYTILERQTNQLIHLVDELMDVSRISRGKVKLQCRSVELEEVLQGAIEATRDLMTRKQHHFKAEFPQQPVLLYADPVRLTQVVLNLLSNAAHYTPPGGEISLQTRIEDDWLQILVSDNGIGMSAEMLDRVFDAFIQIESPMTRDRTETGLGVGLTLARALVQMHGGRIYAESEGAGQGTRFTVCLPLGVAEQQLAPASKAGPARASHFRVLVVDDNRDAAETLAMLLTLNGHEVRTVFSGQAALDAGPDFAPEVVLMDLGMPGMNGIETARALRKTAWGRDLSLVAITGWGQEQDKRITREAGFDHHLVKPVEAATLLQLLSEIAPRSAAPIHPD